MKFDNTYASLPNSFYAVVQPDTVSTPTLLAWNQDLADELGFEEQMFAKEQLARIFSGSDPLPGSFPIAQAYAGHQFGHFAPQLGDGRAVLLGEVIARSGKRFDVQLKGSGRTPFSRGGDGKSWIGPVIREYMLSEAMHCLGIPTTRSLAAVATGEAVFREESKPGAVFTRVASSHLRIGTFQYFAAKNEIDSLRALADYAVSRHYPEIESSESPYVELLRCVTRRQAELIARWMSVGFIHGVMNTDNTTISGETIDYGPAAYMDEFQSNKVFSFIDQQGRYAYVNQPAIGQWNLARLAETLLMLGAEREELEAVLSEYPGYYEEAHLELMSQKMGLHGRESGDAELIGDFLRFLHENKLDYTLSFRALAARIAPDDGNQFGDVESRWRARVSTQGMDEKTISEKMNAVNPLFIPRNHRVEQAIDRAVEGDLSIFKDLNIVLSSPFEEQPEYMKYAEAPSIDERVTQTFCGT